MVGNFPFHYLCNSDAFTTSSLFVRSPSLLNCHLKGKCKLDQEDSSDCTSKGQTFLSGRSSPLQAFPDVVLRLRGSLFTCGEATQVNKSSFSSSFSSNLQFFVKWPFITYVPDVTRCDQLLPVMTSCCQVLPAVARCNQLFPVVTNCCKVWPTGFRCDQVVKAVTSWF